MWPRTHSRRMGPWGGGRRTVTDAAAASSASFSSSSCVPHTELPRPRPPQPSRELGLSLSRTIFIKNLPPTVDNSQKLLPFVPSEGLVALRVKRTGGRDVGFAEYNAVESAYRALQWFYRLEVTAGIALNCFPQMLRKWTPIPPRCCYPVPYNEYNHCAGDPARSTELLLNSVILMAEWSVSTPTCRPAFDSSLTSSRPLSPPYHHDLAQTTTNFPPHEAFQVPRVDFYSPPACHCAGLTPGMAMPQWAARPHISPRDSLYKHSGDSIAEGNADECSGSVERCPVKSGGTMQHTALTGTHPQGSKGRHRPGQEDIGDSPLHVKPLSSRDVASQRGVLDSAAASAALDDKDLPSSTLFVRVMSNGQRRRRETTLSSRSLSASFQKETGKIAEGSETHEVFPSLQYQERWDKQDRQEVRQSNDSSDAWSRFHHRHHPCMGQKSRGMPPTQHMTGATTPDDAAPPRSLNEEEPMCNELMVDETPISPSLLSSLADGERSDTENELAKILLNRNFFSERFAGVCSYVSYSKRAGFVRFEKSGDARRCLLWLRRQPELVPVLNVQFAREDTRRRRSHRSRVK